jgi:hypothetical protein
MKTALFWSVGIILINAKTSNPLISFDPNLGKEPQLISPRYYIELLMHRSTRTQGIRNQMHCMNLPVFRLVRPSYASIFIHVFKSAMQW